MKTKISFIITLLGLCVAGQLCANTLPIHIDPFNTNTYDEIVWGCRLSRCIHVSMERSGRYGGAKEKALIKKYENWLETSGRKLIADWRAGNPISEKDAKYLPLAKTEYWDALIKDYDSSRYYYHDKKFPDLSRFPAEERTSHEEYQAVIESGEAVLRKIYNQEPLSDSDKAAFHEWVLANYSGYYVSGVTPKQISADSRYVFNETMQSGEEIQPGDIFPNVAMYKPEYVWNKPEFSETNYCDVSIHLRAGKTDELLQRYIDHVQYWEPAPGDYPKVRPACPPADAPDTDEYRTLYNLLAEENKPVLFGTWTINNDEGQLRMAPRLHFLHRALRNKVGFAIAEGAVNSLTEKNDLRFDPSTNEMYRTHLLRSFTAPYLPTPYVSPITRFFKPIRGMNVGNLFRILLINQNAEFLGAYTPGPMNGDFGGHLCRVLGVEKRLIEGFKTPTGFDPDLGGSNLIPSASYDSVVSNRMAQCASNGYNITAYSRYGNHIDAIGEIIAVDADKHTVTLLREEYHEEEYPIIALKERFPTTYAEYESGFRGGAGKFHFDDLAARKKAGNSKSARTMKFNVNVGVGMFLNGEEKEEESCLKVGDVASIVYLEGKGGYPHFIRALRFNFAPQIQSMANTGAQTVELRGINDENLIVDQDIIITAESLEPAKMADPVVSYTIGDTVCVLTYTAPAPGDTVTVRVILTDDGGAEFGGTNATEVLLKFTESGAVLASPPDSDGDGMPDT